MHMWHRVVNVNYAYSSGKRMIRGGNRAVYDFVQNNIWRSGLIKNTPLRMDIQLFNFRTILSVKYIGLWNREAYSYSSSKDYKLLKLVILGPGLIKNFHVRIYFAFQNNSKCFANKLLWIGPVVF